MKKVMQVAKALALLGFIYILILFIKVDLPKLECALTDDDGALKIGTQMTSEEVVSSTVDNTTEIISNETLTTENVAPTVELMTYTPPQDARKSVTFDVIVSYYTYLPQSTGTGNGITASGKKVSNTSLAIPRNDNILKFGSVVQFDFLCDSYMKDYNGQYLERIADDTGSPKHIRRVNDTTYRVDVFCPRLNGESDSAYHKRVYAYGKTKTKMKVYLD